jgi:hypothetical protein
MHVLFKTCYLTCVEAASNHINTQQSHQVTLVPLLLSFFSFFTFFEAFDSLRLVASAMEGADSEGLPSGWIPASESC